MNVLLNCLVVGGAGFVGALARYGVNALVGRLVDARFPLATLLINVTGSFALGWFLGAFGDRLGPAHPLRLGVAMGFLGAYTTFSTFAFEADGLLRHGEVARCAAYVGASVVLGVAACAAGVAVGR